MNRKKAKYSYAWRGFQLALPNLIVMYEVLLAVAINPGEVECLNEAAT